MDESRAIKCSAPKNSRRGRGFESSERIYFNADVMGETRPEYVVWIDGMGTGRALETSLEHAANFVFKLHVAVSDARSDGCRLYPMMDGIYVTCTSLSKTTDFLRRAFRRLANEFVSQPENTKRFLTRAGVAFGPVLHGGDIPDTAIHPSSLAPLKTKSALLLSPAMERAYRAERSAAPFGAYADSTALSYPRVANDSDRGFPCKMWTWWQDGDKSLVKKLSGELTQYFAEAAHNELNWGYSTESRVRHEKSFTEYFRPYLPARSDSSTSDPCEPHARLRHETEVSPS